MQQTGEVETHSTSRLKFIIGGSLIVAAITYLIISSTIANAHYFMTVNELTAKGSSIIGRDIRISGAVIGDSIEYNPQSFQLLFTIAHVPGDNKEIEAAGGLSKVLHQAVIDPTGKRLQVIYNGVMPDLLRNESQAIITGKLGEDGVFYAKEILLKCPTKYEDAIPDQAEESLR
jgi:cytochrome c-type biogenesis protein CcmE